MVNKQTQCSSSCKNQANVTSLSHVQVTKHSVRNKVSSTRNVCCEGSFDLLRINI